MLDPHQQHSLLEELDLRQQEVLDQLDELNGRIERTIEHWSPRRTDESVPSLQ